MEVELLSKKENILLNRIELKFKVTHKNEKTPEKESVKAKIASLINLPKENIVIAWMRTLFGTQETLGYAKAYSSAQATLKSEHEYLLARNKIIEPKEKKVAKPKVEAKPEEKKKEEGKEEKKEAETKT
ncbi:MAG: 30S ribosomal protein S24e [Candidatus Thermoplasmatota archaeon]